MAAATTAPRRAAATRTLASRETLATRVTRAIPAPPVTRAIPAPPEIRVTPGGSSHGGNKPGGQFVTQPDGDAQLASTGSDLPLGLALPAGAGALLAGAILYRKARASA